ncbi:MAG: TIGR03936 family radical SAM-associated protein, partial [Candidatus Cloacimonetes bacterium]|nr:TIGR03936 family radical SAM-associated protein [Candidatus Cloacimonadota bacterium]
SLGDSEELIRKATKIKYSFSKQRFVKIKYHDIESLLLEGIMGRGDRSVSALILQAYKNGAIFDGWREHFNFERWQTAADELNFDMRKHLDSININSNLIWDHINIGINKKFLKNEWDKAKEAATTADCRTGKCSGCGVCKENIQNKFAKPIAMKPINIPEKVIPDQIQSYFYRVYYQKMDRMRFVAHLDLLRMTHRFMRVAKFPLAYSQGFNPHPRISFGPPLPVGVHGQKEYFVFALTEERDVNDLHQILNLVMPQQLKFMGVEKLTSKTERAMDYFNLEEVVVHPSEKHFTLFQEKASDFLAAENWEFTKIRKKKERLINLKQIVKTLSFEDGNLLVTKEVIGASIFDILEHVFGISREETTKFDIIRKGFRKG